MIRNIALFTVVLCVPSMQWAQTAKPPVIKKGGASITKPTGMSPAHGSTDMPVWGPIFRQMGNDQLRMYNLKQYVDTLQTR